MVTGDADAVEREGDRGATLVMAAATGPTEARGENCVGMAEPGARHTPTGADLDEASGFSATGGEIA